MPGACAEELIHLRGLASRERSLIQMVRLLAFVADLIQSSGEGLREYQLLKAGGELVDKAG